MESVEVDVDVGSLLSDWDSEEGADDCDVSEVAEVLRVFCLERDFSLVVEELLEEDTARAVET